VREKRKKEEKTEERQGTKKIKKLLNIRPHPK